jgi:PKD repeat protein
MKEINNTRFFRLFAICTALFLVATSSNALLLDEYSILVESDQEYYYPGETVYVTGQLLKNGEGIAGGYCPKALDPENNTYWNPGLCYMSNSDGTFEFNFSITQGSMLGTYTISVRGYIDAWEGYGNITIEVVSEEVIAEANGPYEGTVGEPIDFFGGVSGGKPPYTWHWDFGDEGTSDEQNPSYTYDEAGEYVAALTVTDAGLNEGVDTANVNVSPIENLPPNDPGIDGETNGNTGESFTYTIVTTDPDDDDVKYVIEWGDNETTETEYCESGEEIEVLHSWDEDGTYTIRVKAIDVHDAESGWTELEVNMPVSQNLFDSFFIRLLNRFPHAFPILRILLGI